MPQECIKDTYIYDSVDVAKYMTLEASDKRIFMNITKVQKLLYVVYGVYLRVYGERLVNEHPQAWPYGPVFPETRLALRGKKLSPATNQDLELNEAELGKMENDTRLKRVIEFVFKNFGSWNAGQLTEWSHGDGSPWKETVNGDDFDWGNVIPDRFILDYFNKIINVKN